MLPALALCLALASGPSSVGLASAPRHAHLVFVSALTSEQIAEAPLDSLSLAQLRQEDARLADAPSITGPIVMISAGGAMLTFGIIATYLLFNAISGAGIAGIFFALFGIVTAAIGIAGAVLGITGGILLPNRLAQRDQYAQRRAAVQARMAAIASGAVSEPAQARDAAESEHLQNELNQLELERPSLGLPIGLLAGGTGAVLYGVYYWSTLSSSGSTSTGTTALWIGAIVAGLIADGIGTWLLIDRLRTRADIDDKVRSLQGPSVSPQVPAPPQPGPGPEEVPPGGEPVAPPPPPLPPSAQQLPPPPIFFALAWRF